MNKILLLFFYLFFTIFIHSIELSQDYIFINSHPGKAKVLIDGIDKGILTPCIIKNLNVLNKNIKIIKEGYNEYNINIAGIKSKKLDVYLTPESFALYFPELNIYNINNNQFKGPLFITNLQKGNYKINIFNNQIQFKKISNFLPAKISLGTALGISASYMFISLGLSEYYNFKYQTSINDFDRAHYELVANGMNISKYIGISLTSLVGIVFLGIVIADLSIKYYEKNQALKVEQKIPSDQGKTLYDSALQFLSIGEIDKSCKILESVLLLYPQSDYIPQVYYQLGQNYFVLKEFDFALRNWEIFIYDYPLADYYDYVLKNIAEIYYIKEDLKKAVTIMDNILFTEDILEREDIYSFKAKLNIELYFKEPNENNYKTTENQYLALINNYANSEKLGFYYLDLIKLYNKVGDTDKLLKLKNKAEQIPDISIRNLILSYF